jgi:hypothetical protein
MSFEFGPPLVVKPAHELLGEMLQQAQKYSEAQKQFDLSLAHAPGRSLSLLGLKHAAESAGDQAAAATATAELRKILQKADAGVATTIFGKAGI